MLVLLINEINLIAFALLLVFFSSSRVKLSHTEDSPHHLLYSIFENLPWEFAARICRGYLPREFAAGICRGNLPQEFAVAICRGFFVYVSEYFFVYVSKSCLYGSKPFLHVSETFLFVRFSLSIVFLFVIAVAVMGHRTI